MDSLSVFEFNQSEFRVFEVLGDLWFVATDIANLLQHSDVSTMCSKLKQREKLIQTLFVSGQNRDVLCVSESGLYRILMRSNKPQAEPFQDWIAEEVIPSIRKTGRYAVRDQVQAISPLDLFEQSLNAIKANTHQVKQLQSSLHILESNQDELRLKAVEHDRHLDGVDAELDRLKDPDGHYFTIIGYGMLLGLRVSRKEASKLGRTASMYCKANGLRKERVFDSSFGEVGNYPQESLQYAFRQYNYIAPNDLTED